MATEIDLEHLNYPNPWVREAIIRGEWPELLPHQWAILAGQPVPFMPWEVVLITREEYEAEMVGNGVSYFDRYLQQSMPRSAKPARTNLPRQRGPLAWILMKWKAVWTGKR